MTTNVRALAAQCIYSVIDQGRSLSTELPVASRQANARDTGLLQELVYGVLRYLPELEYCVSQFLDKPLKGKNRVFHHLLLVGIYQLKYLRVPDHAAVGETVAATLALKNKNIKGLINGVLRNYLRQPTDLNTASEPVRFNHPSWLINKLKLAYPEQWQNVLAENQFKPPMWIRINQQKSTVEHYLTLLSQAEIEVAETDNFTGAVKLAQATDVNKLPHFADGWASVQDAAAQYAALLLDVQPGDLVLDCCAAPGGKTCQILERTDDRVRVVALDIDQERLVRVQQNLDRIGLNAELVAGDAAQADKLFAGQSFNRILLDAPCSATGVIRRHPDIKWLRKASDIDALVQLQQQILHSVWQLLAPGGTLVYATCSVLPEENTLQIQRFIETMPDAKLVADDAFNGDKDWQILPGTKAMDGFYYAKLTKQR